MIQLLVTSVSEPKELVLGVLVNTRTPFMAFSIAASASFPAGTSLSFAILTFAS